LLQPSWERWLVHAIINNKDVAIAAAGSLLHFGAPGKALSHFQKHAAEFGGAFQNAVQYLGAARSLITSTSSDVIRYKNAAGKVLVYNTKTNEFATHTGKTIHTLFKPNRGQAYVNDVISKGGYKLVQ
jgi:pyocin large subunit-like protein